MLFNVFAIFNNPTRVQFNGGWHDKLENNEVVPDLSNIDIQIEGHIELPEFEQTKLGKSGQITGKALLQLASSVATARDFTSKLSVISDDTVYSVITKKINKKPCILRHTLNKAGQPVTFVSVRHLQASKPAASVEL